MTKSHHDIFGMRVDVTSYAAATQQVIDWSQESESRYICVANVHMAMEAFDNPEFRDVVNGADIVTPDGMPLVWLLRKAGARNQQRVYGPTLTLTICEALAKKKTPVGFYGSSVETLKKLDLNLQRQFPDLNIVYIHSPPYRDLTEEEDAEIVKEINESGVKVLFVGLGCPMQEWWMVNHRDRLQVVMAGVGASFDFHAGMVQQAPSWIQNTGLEWLFRLFMEPRRLWKRYVFTNSKFIWRLLCSWLFGKNKVARTRYMKKE